MVGGCDCWRDTELARKRRRGTVAGVAVFLDTGRSRELG